MAYGKKKKGSSKAASTSRPNIVSLVSKAFGKRAPKAKIGRVMSRGRSVPRRNPIKGTRRGQKYKP